MELKGTEKQISYATEIRAGVLEIKNILEEAKEKVDLTKTSKKWIFTTFGEEVETSEESLRRILKQEDSRFYIENFKGLKKSSVEELKKYEEDYQIDYIYTIIQKFKYLMIEDELINIDDIKINLNYCELKGSKKQIDWANQIRIDLTEFLYKALQIRLSCSEEYNENDTKEKIIERFNRALKNLMENFDSAQMIINFLNVNYIKYATLDERVCEIRDGLRLIRKKEYLKDEKGNQRYIYELENTLRMIRNYIY